METINLRKMVRSLYGWVDHIHTSLKVGYPPHPSKKEKVPQSTCKRSIDLEAVEEIFLRGPTAAETATTPEAADSKITAKLTHSVSAS